MKMAALSLLLTTFYVVLIDGLPAIAEDLAPVYVVLVVFLWWLGRRGSDHHA